MFYLFYRFAEDGTEISFVFLGLGMFVFFGTIAWSVKTIRRAEWQRAVSWSLPEESRDKWFEQRKALKDTRKDIHEFVQSTIKKREQRSKEDEKDRRRYKRDSRRQKSQARLNAISRAWMKLRLKLGGTWLLTALERAKLKTEEFKVNMALKELKSDLNRKDVMEIRSGKVDASKNLANSPPF